MGQRNPKFLDVGSGNHPHPEAGVLLEKYKDNTSRGGDLVVPEGVKFIEGDVEDMPFKDKEFDFVNCSNVLEHVDDPEKACKELMRVAKAGYIECPRYFWEVLFGRKYHKWFVNIKGNKIIFVNKAGKIPENTFDGDKLYSNVPEFREMFVSNHHLFYAKFQWKESFEVEVSK